MNDHDIDHGIKQGPGATVRLSATAAGHTAPRRARDPAAAAAGRRSSWARASSSLT